MTNPENLLLIAALCMAFGLILMITVDPAAFAHLLNMPVYHGNPM